MYISVLENITLYIFFIRPRRFGKSLFLNMIENYYDINKASSFDELFGDLSIGKNPTDLKNNYFILKLNFSGLNAATEDKLESSFINAVIERVVSFLEYYQEYFHDITAVVESLNQSRDLRQIMEKLFHLVPGLGIRYI